MDKIKVLVVDDSSVIRSIVKEALTVAKHIEEIGRAHV